MEKRWHTRKLISFVQVLRIQWEGKQACCQLRKA